MKTILLFLFLSLNLFAQSSILTLFSDNTFNPQTDITSGTLTYWFEWDDLTTVTKNANNKVTLWTNKITLTPADNLAQADTSKSPTYGDGLIFDGTGDFMKTSGAVNVTQPSTVIAVLKQISWKDYEYLWDGNNINNCSLGQRNASPELDIYAGAELRNQAGLTIGEYGIVTAIYNGVNSSIQINDVEAVTGNAGTTDMSGLTLARYGSVDSDWSNVAFKYILIYNGALSASDIALVKLYLREKAGL